MSDEVKLKVNVPMFEVGELEVFDNNIHSIVEEYSKMLFKEKGQILTQRIIMKQEDEIERLKQQLQQKENIIKEVREYIEKYETIYGYFNDNNFNGEYIENEIKDNILEILERSDKE